MFILATVKVIPRDDSGTARSIKIQWTVGGVIAAFDTRPPVSWLNKLDVVVVSINLRISSTAHLGIKRTNPRQTLPSGFPRPPAPPLESYCPPESPGLRRVSFSGRIHPVTGLSTLSVMFVLQLGNNVRCAYLAPRELVPVLNATLLQKSTGNWPWIEEYRPEGEQYVFIPPGCSLSPMLV